MKKLIYILNSYSETDASHFTHILHLLEIMAHKGCSVVLIIEKAEGLPAFKNPNVRVVGLKSQKPFLRHVELFRLIGGLISDGYEASFVRISAVTSIVASVAHHIHGGRSYLWQSGTTHEHDWAQPPSLKKFRWWIFSFVPNWLARRLTQYFVTGPEAMVDYYANVVGVPRSKIKLLYNDIQIERFQDVVVQEERRNFLADRNIPEEITVLLLVHRLSPVRRTLMYLKPLLIRLKENSHESDWVLIIAGSGSELPEAKSIVAELGLGEKVIFLGNVPNKEIPRLYAVGDVFVHPTYTEGFPRVLIEAMAAGLPIVTTDAGGTAQLLGDKQRRFLVDKSQPEAFVEAAVDLIKSPECWLDLSRENKAVVERFSTPAVASMYMNTIFGDAA